jgi:hypothetical protein
MAGLKQKESLAPGDMGVGWRWRLEAGPYNMTGSYACKLLITYKQKSLPSEEGNACCSHYSRYLQNFEFLACSLCNFFEWFLSSELFIFQCFDIVIISKLACLTWLETP